MTPKRIVFVISSLGPGGAERVASLLTSKWADTGISVTLVTTFLFELDDDFYPLSPLIHRVRLANLVTRNGRSVTDNFVRGITFRRLVQSTNPDVVISFMDRVNVLTLLSLAGTSFPVIVCERSNPFLQKLSNKWELLRRFTYKKMAAVVCCQSTAVAEKLNSLWQISTFSLPNPLSPDIPTNIDSCLKRQQIILCVGRLSPEKGHDLLLHSWATLADEYPDWTLRMVGDGVLRDNLLQTAKKLGIQKRVEWVGTVKNAWSEYQNSQIFVLPSRYEGFPNALLEAMALGCACISTNCDSGPAQMIQDGVSGLLCETEDVNAMSLALRKLLDSPALRQAYGKNAQDIRQKFSLEAHLQRWENIFVELS